MIVQGRMPPIWFDIYRQTSKEAPTKVRPKGRFSLCAGVSRYPSAIRAWTAPARSYGTDSKSGLEQDRAQRVVRILPLRFWLCRDLEASRQNVEVAFPALMSSSTSYSNDLECAGLFDELRQPLHVRCPARPARIVGPAVDVFLRPAVVNRAEVRHSVEHRIVGLSVR
jgi:hypothetical protein